MDGKKGYDEVDRIACLCEKERRLVSVMSDHEINGSTLEHVSMYAPSGRVSKNCSMSSRILKLEIEEAIYGQG